jgi:hypothetical protein
MIAMVLAGLCAMMAGAAEVRNVTAEQRWSPWAGKVKIQFEVVGEVPTNAWLEVAATDLDYGVSYMAMPIALSGDTGNEVGTHQIEWDLDKQGANLQSDHVEFTVAYSDRRHPAYGVFSIIDLSAGTNAVAYPVTYVTNLPGIDIDFNTDEYKTTKLVLRRIEPGTFMMCGEYEVTLTKPFYIGIFEVTQKQYELVTGGNPSGYKGDMRPVEKVSWNAIRGDSTTYNWPTITTVDGNTFMGQLRFRTGLDFDLPTEAQWEFACRAGTTNTYNNGGETEDALKVLGRYTGNSSDGQGGYSEHTTVGSYMPNAWGLYDMHGNVEEWCLDWYGALTNGVMNPEGSLSGSHRVIRGGGFRSGNCSSSYRGYVWNPSNARDYSGFRLVRNLSE